MKGISIIRALLVILLVVGSVQVCFGQTADLRGFIRDKSQAVIPNASIAVVNEATGVRRTASSNNEGLYVIPYLRPGTYSITVQNQGFQTLRRTGVVFEVGQEAQLDFVLEVGKIETTVVVSGEAPLISTSSSVGTVINRQFVGDLPLNGRSFQSLILLSPGVTVTPTPGGNDLGQFSVNGQRASTNYFTVDGVSANVGVSMSVFSATLGALSGAYPGLSALGGTNSLVSVDALEEFKIQTSTYAAEYGRQPGGQISLVTRSGANKFHGTLFEYLRNSALDARDFFNKVPAAKAAMRQNNFGGTFSGPIFKDRTFFFFSYEGQRLRIPTSGTVYVPSVRERQLDPANVQSVVNAFPIPTGPEVVTSGALSGWAPFNYTFSNPSTLNAYSIRVDHIINSKHTLFGRFNQSPSSSTNYSAAAYATSYVASTRTATLGATSTLTPWLNNELRFNYSRQVGEQAYAQTGYGGAVPIDPTLLTNGLGGVGGAFIIFGGRVGVVYVGDPTKNYQRQMNIVDTVSVVKGQHQFKFGVDYRRLSPTYSGQDVETTQFTSENSLLKGKPDSVTISANYAARPTYPNFSAFGQDTWKVTPRLTLDLGLRWEFNPAPTEAEGKIPPLVLGVVPKGAAAPDTSQAILAPAGTPFYKAFYTAFAPRFGAAYQLRATSGRETVLRGGFGTYYDLGSAGAMMGFPLNSMITRTPATFPITNAEAARTPYVLPTSLPITVTAYANSESLKLPYTLQWNVALEQSLGTQQSLSISYVGSAGRRLLTEQQVNGRAGYTTGPRANPNFSTIYYVWNGPSSDYHSMQLQYKARFKSGLQALVNYTWSHSIDDVSTDLGTMVLTRGNSNFDIRHNFSAAVTYDFPKLSSNGPFGESFARFVKGLANGWSMDGIVHVQSALPIDIAGNATVIDGMYVQTRPNVVPGQPFYIYDSSVPGGRRFNSAAFTSPPPNPAYPSYPLQGNFGRNVLRQEAIYQIDTALGRSFMFTEKLKLQFKCEVFNILNHPMFGYFSTSYTSPSTFGVPSRTLGNYLMGSSGAGLNQLYQIGGNRSIQLSLKMTF